MKLRINKISDFQTQKCQTKTCQSYQSLMIQKNPQQMLNSFLEQYGVNRTTI